MLRVWRIVPSVLTIVCSLFLSACGGMTITIQDGSQPTIQIGVTVAPRSQPTTRSGNTNTGNVSNVQWGVRTKTSGCRASGGLQDKACTPGDVIPGVTASQICQPGYARSVRNVSTSEKDEVYAEYGIASHATGEYEVDHLVSLELGGSNDISNLWPEAAEPKPGFHEKDSVENYLHDQLCSGAISLQQAQQEIATNWLDVYNRMPK